MVYKNMTELIGRTPLLELVNLEKPRGLAQNLLQSLSTSIPQAA